MAQRWISSLRISRRRLLQSAAATGGLGLLTGLYTWQIEPHWLEVVERDLPISNLPTALQGARLAQLTDLHIGPRVSDSYLLGVFERVKALAPEIVVYTGDFTTYAPDVTEHTKRIMAHLPTGRRATFGVLGNHDYGIGWSDRAIADQIAGIAAAAGVQMLRNEVAEVDGLQFAGADDLWSSEFNVRRTVEMLDLSRPAIALTHNPDSADRPGWKGFLGWILCGHTHGGQCKPPFLPPPLLPVKNRRYTAGEFDLHEGRRMYVSRGIGHLLQVRFNARPEVTVFRLTPA